MTRATRPGAVAFLVAGLPLAALGGIAATVYVALRAPADASSGSPTRYAQVQNEDLSPDLAALRLGVHASVAADARRGTIFVRLEPGTLQRPAALVLALRHPTFAASDRLLSLRRGRDGWHGRTEPWPATQSWQLELTPRAGDWRIGGRLEPSRASATLRPRVES
jgi:hypothetical protein